jgi:predicted kinase
MRKWMRDRLKRPKKNTEGNQSGSAQAPLQPAFYDAANATAPAAPIRLAENETQPSPQPLTIQEVASETRPSAPPRAAGSGDPRRRRRRGRGGRGRGGTQAAPAPPAEESRAGAAESPQPDAGSAPEIAGAIKTTPPAAPRASKGTVVLAIGLPGSGKSSWFKRHNITPLSSDMVRALLFDDPTEQRFQDLVFSNLRSMLKARLIARRPMNYVDATNLTPHERQSWIKLGQDYGYEVQAVFFDVPLEVCLERNHKRERVVADDVMRRMSAKLKAPTFDEGFSKITVVRVKRKE